MSLDQLKDATVAVLLGGDSAEREVSLQSGATVVEALRSNGLSVREVDPADRDWIAQLEGVAFTSLFTCFSYSLDYFCHSFLR